MANQNLFAEIKTWKKPLHILRNLLAKNYLKFLSNVKIIGITGSVGKTLTQNAIYSVLSQKYRTMVGDENLDPTFRIPKTILAAKPWHNFIVLEYGIEHLHDMDSYLAIAKPNIAVITKIAPTHLKYLKTQDEVFHQKAKIIKALPRNGMAILNSEDPYLKKLKGKTHAKIIWSGPHQRGVKISHFAQDSKGSTFRLHFKEQKATVNWKIIGRHHLLSAYIAADLGLYLGLTLKQIAKGLSQTKSPLHRLTSIESKDLTIIDDSYNSSPQAVREAVKTLTQIGKGRQKIAVLGEMKDLGDFAKDAHRQVGLQIAKTPINYLMTVGAPAKEISTACKKAQFKGKIITVSTTEQAIQKIREVANKKSTILVKGSRHAHLERIVYGLLHKSTQINCYHCGTLK